jgi:hypothetical protein
VAVARNALDRGFQPVPIKKGTKRPAVTDWPHRRYDEKSIQEGFGDSSSIGLVLGSVSNGLVDIDIDHPLVWRLAKIFLPPTRMRSGRAGNPNSHYWYRVTDSVPGYRKYTLPGGETLVELRSSEGHQTLIPPSIHTSGEVLRWEAEPWGGEDGPSEVLGAALAVRVASLALAATLVENWPTSGSRHDAFLALAGGMLRLGAKGVHPYWSQALPPFIESLAEATHDKDGGGIRIGEVMGTTEAKLQAGGKVQGWTTLESIITEQSVEKAKRLVREIEDIVDWRRHFPLQSTNQPLLKDLPDDGGGEEAFDEDGVPVPADKNPLIDRDSTWEPVNLEPYLAGEVVVPDPIVLRRTDGKGIFYPGRVNSMYGRSESAKSWVALYASLQEMMVGERVIYVDLEDDPAMTIKRLRAIGAGDDDIRYQFTYIRPEGPHAVMQRDTWGNPRPTEPGYKNAAEFQVALDQVNPGLIIVDGMSVLYGFHGLNTNDVSDTDVITNWLKALTRHGRTTVIVIDHTNKGAEKGATPTGSQHKISMVQGSAIQVVPVDQPKPGAIGHVQLVIGKDRPGEVRKIANDDKHPVVADVFLDSRIDDVTRVEVRVPDPNEQPYGGTDATEKELSEAAIRADLFYPAFKDNPTARLSLTEWHRLAPAVTGSRSTVQRAVDYLVSQGKVIKTSTRGQDGNEYWLADERATD